MPIPDEEIVRRVFSANGRESACRLAVENAWTTVKDGYPERVWWRRKSTRAGLMWEHSVNNAASLLESDSGVRVVPHHDTSSFIFDDIVLARFKKASIQLHTHNYPTLLATLFHQHDRDLLDFEGHHRVEIAHVFNTFETGLDWIGVVARERKRVLWHFELEVAGAVVESLPLRQPAAPAGDRVLRPTAPSTEETSEKETE